MAIDLPFIWIAFKEIIKSVPITLILTVVPLVVGFLIGIVVAFIRIYKTKLLYQVANGYVSFLEELQLSCIL